MVSQVARPELEIQADNDQAAAQFAVRHRSGGRRGDVVNWMRVCPVYPVADVGASIEWYGRVFGFVPLVVNPPGEVPVYAVLTRGGASIHLLRQDEAPHGLKTPVQAQFWIDGDLDELFDSVQRMGVDIVQPPGDQPWGHRDFMVADPDRNIVWVTIPKR